LSHLGLTLSRYLLIGLDPVLPALLYLLGCWLLWRSAASKDTGLRRLVVGVGAAQVFVLLSTLAMFSITQVGNPVDPFLSDIRLYAGWLLPPALALLVLAVFAEPYTTTRLSGRANAVAWAVAVVALAAWALTPVESAPGWFRLLVGVPHSVSVWPVRHAYLGTGGLFATAGVPSSVAALVSPILWVTGFWYVAARAAMALIRVKLGLSARHLTGASS